MIRQLLALAAALALAGCDAPQREWPDPSPALWEVTGRNGEHGWLFGTIHALPDGLTWETPKISSALDQSDLLVVEIENLSDHAGSAAFDEAATSPGLPPLLQRVPSIDRPAVAEAMRRGGYAEANFSDTETWAAALIIANGVRNGETENGVDRELLDRGLPVTGLESFAGQFAIFDHLAEADQAVLLIETARDGGTGTEDRLAEAWLSGNLTTLERETQRGVLADPELRQALLTRRNAAWAERVAELMTAGHRPFVAVGAAHVVGDEGLPALLAARGYTVTRVQ